MPDDSGRPDCISIRRIRARSGNRRDSPGGEMCWCWDRPARTFRASARP
ncbi:hypothetical protein ACFWD7_33415 [Streptomyces mirabilis]|nr:hypothetical protein [Streptomyces mirabilis]MCT9114072.1 hypothetical protein [Streptomyces mirabilis]